MFRCHIKSSLLVVFISKNSFLISDVENANSNFQYKYLSLNIGKIVKYISDISMGVTYYNYNTCVISCLLIDLQTHLNKKSYINGYLKPMFNVEITI